MAEEEVIVLEEGEKGQAEQVAELEEEALEEEKKKKKKKLLIIGGAAGSALLLLIIILIIVLSGGDDDAPKDAAPTELAKKLIDSKNKPIDLSELEIMIKKANLFYDKGDKKDALALFEKISMYSDAISNYNLGVAQMKEKSYEEALKSFQKAIDIGEDRSFAALNSAICSYHLGREDSFRYYIELARVYLPQEGTVPLYSYVYALHSYYSRDYFEALSPLLHKSGDYYESEHSHLLAKLYLLYDDNLKAIDALEKHATAQDWMALSLLYARIGEWDISKDYIARYILDINDSMEANIAKSLIELKSGTLMDASNTLNNSLGKFKDMETNNPYNTYTKLKDELFDINSAQERFRKNFGVSKNDALKILFYFSSYKVFDTENALIYIKKGSMNIFIDELKEAKELLQQGSTISKVNINIAKAISLALDHKTREANKLLKDVVDMYPNHSILHYNLGLSYAHLGQYDLAYKHFLRSYHLDNRDTLTGVYAMISAELTHKDYGRLKDSITEDLDHFSGDEHERRFIFALINFLSGNVTSTLEWFEGDKPKKPIYLALENLIAHKINDTKRYKEKAKDIKELLKGDVLAETFSLFANHGSEDIKTFSLNSQYFFKLGTLNKDSIFYGPSVVRELYTRLAYITGAIHYVNDEFKEKALVEKYDTRGVMQALALTNIYTKQFEEAYTIYNDLVDRRGEKDSNTLFMAAVAAIASHHHANAIALLELSRLTDTTNLESRYALGLLYQEAKNYKAASTQYGAIGNINYNSDYFDFEIIDKRE